MAGLAIETPSGVCPVFLSISVFRVRHCQANHIYDLILIADLVFDSPPTPNLCAVLTDVTLSTVDPIYNFLIPGPHVLAIRRVVVLPVGMSRLCTLRELQDLLIRFEVVSHWGRGSVDMDTFGPCSASGDHGIVDGESGELVSSVLVISVERDVEVAALNALFLTSFLDPLTLGLGPVHHEVYSLPDGRHHFGPEPDGGEPCGHVVVIPLVSTRI